MSPRDSWKAALAATLLIAAFVAPAEAVPVLRFDNFVDTGVLQYNTLGGSLTGSNIGFDFLVATDTPANAGTYTCLGCVLDFETGPNLTTGPLLYQWAPGGTFTITGEVDGVTGPTTLLSGTFTLATAVGVNLPGSGSDILIFSGSGLDAKDGVLLDFFGLTGTSFRFANTEISTTATVNPNGTFIANVDEADVTNTAVPEPGTTMLVLLGLSSLAAYRRRQG